MEVKIARNEACPCGSGRKFKHCCIRSVVNGGRPFSEIRSRNLALVEVVAKIFKFDKVKHAAELKQFLNPAAVRTIFLEQSKIFPPEDPYSLIPKAEPTSLRALYLGDIRPQDVSRNVLRCSLYADEILMFDPFPRVWHRAAKYDPIRNPQFFMEDTLKLANFIYLLGPWIRSGVVTLVPDPADYDYEVFEAACVLGRQRFATLTLTDEDKADLDEMIFEHYYDLLLLEPEDVLEESLASVWPDVSRDDKRRLLQRIRGDRVNNPLIPRQSLTTLGGQMHVTRSGASLDVAILISKMSGAFPFTASRRRWRESTTETANLPPHTKTWSPLTQAFNRVQLQVLNNVGPEFAIRMREEGRLASFRNLLRNIWATTSADSQGTNENVLGLQDALGTAYETALADWEAIRIDFARTFPQMAVAAAGLSFAASGVTSQANIKLGFAAVGFAASPLYEVVKSTKAREAFRKKEPMSILIDLASK